MDRFNLIEIGNNGSKMVQLSSRYLMTWGILIQPNHECYNWKNCRLREEKDDLSIYKIPTLYYTNLALKFSFPFFSVGVKHWEVYLELVTENSAILYHTL